MYMLYSRPEWAELTRGYRAIMVADDDLEMDTCVLNRRAWGVWGLRLAASTAA